MSRAVIVEYKFRSRLTELMKEKELNQAELAAKVGFSRKAINEYLNGKSCPDKWHLHELAKFFNVFDEYLSGETEYRDAGEMADKSLTEGERETLIRHLEMMRYFDIEFGLNDYEHGKTIVLESHTETEIVDGKEIEVQCIDDFENDYTRLLKDIEAYVIFKAEQFKSTHPKIEPIRKAKKARKDAK